MARSGNKALLALWRERLTSSENVGRTVKELATLFDVHVTTVQYWRGKVAELDRAEQVSRTTPSAFVPVIVQAPASPEQIIVKLPGDVTICLPCAATSALVAVLTALKLQG